MASFDQIGDEEVECSTYVPPIELASHLVDVSVLVKETSVFGTLLATYGATSNALSLHIGETGYADAGVSAREEDIRWVDDTDGTDRFDEGTGSNSIIILHCCDVELFRHSGFDGSFFGESNGQ